MPKHPDDSVYSKRAVSTGNKYCISMRGVPEKRLLCRSIARWIHLVSFTVVLLRYEFVQGLLHLDLHNKSKEDGGNSDDKGKETHYPD